MKLHRASRTFRAVEAVRAPAGRLGRLATNLPGKRLLGALRGLVADVRSSARHAALQRLPDVATVGRSIVDRVLPEPYATARQVINATGILVPDALEPALAPTALDRIREQAGVAAAVPESLSPPDHRPEAALHLAARMADAEAALALHSPAGALAATFAALAGTLATPAADGAASGGQGEVVVARRQLGTVCRRHGLSVIDVAATAHARLCEVGSVDRLTIDDYSQPRAQRVAMMLWVEGADYEIVGAGERQPSREDLAAIARRLGAPLVVFLPTAALCPIAGLDASIPRVGQAIAGGADVVVLGGERYLGGPVCGIIVGRRRWVEAIAAAPLAKLLMADRLTLAALEATLLAARDRSAGEREIPLWQMLAASLDVLKSRAQRLAPQIADCARVAGVEIAAGFAYLGPGKLARERVDDWRILVEPSGGGADELAGAIRAASPSVWSTLAGGRLCLSMRSMLARDDERLVAAFAQLGTRRAKGPSDSATGLSDSAKGPGDSAKGSGERKTKVAPAGARPASGVAGSSSSTGGSEAPGPVTPEEAKAMAAQAERFAEE